MDALLEALHAVCVQILPIIGAVVLVFLCIFLKKLWQLIDGISATVKSLDPTIKLVDQSIEKVQAPLDTAVKYSRTLDNVHDKTVESINKAAEAANENAGKIKDFFLDKFNKQADAYVEKNTSSYFEVTKDEPDIKVEESAEVPEEVSVKEESADHE